MNQNLIKSLKVAVAAVLFASTGFSPAHAENVLDIDTTEVLFGFIEPADPPLYSAAEEARLRTEVSLACREAEAIWEARIVGYSTVVPAAIRTQLSSLKIRCEIVEIDGPGEILAQAGPDAVVSVERTVGLDSVKFTLPLEATVTFDYDDLGLMSAEGILTQVAAHEIGHAIGFGTFILQENNLSGPVSPISGLEGYVGGKFALAAYRRETGNSFATFIPLQQTEDGAGGHWIQTFEVFDPSIAATRPDLMVPFVNVNNTDVFITETTFGAMADLGYAVTGYTTPQAAGLGRWPKIIGPDLAPFDGAGTRFDTEGIRFLRVTGQTDAVRARAESGAGKVIVAGPTPTDPFNLRRHRWVRRNK